MLGNTLVCKLAVTYIGTKQEKTFLYLKATADATVSVYLQMALSPLTYLGLGSRDYTLFRHYLRSSLQAMQSH